MASRSGAGTGVIVALVVFILTTVCLLVLTIAFYSQRTAALDQEAEARRQLEQYARREERGREEFKAIEGAASAARQSVAGYLLNQLGDMAAMVAGNRGATPAQIRAELGIGENDVIRNVLADARRQVQTRGNEASTATARVTDLTRQIESLNTQIAQLQQQNQEVVGQISGTLLGYADSVAAAEAGYRTNIATSDRTRSELEREWRDRYAELERNSDALRADNALMGQRVRQLQSVVDAIRIKPKNPAELVDGRIVDIGSDDEVFINLGARDRVVLGMTFEVYDDENAIQVDPRTGQEVRGKGSIQVTRVGDRTSTARVTRSTPGRPIVPNNVIANAVFDPKHKFRFLVHGRFDVNDDGRPTAAGADFVRSRIQEWGGVLIEGDELTGDLDFLVLGEQPPLPAPLPPNADVTRFNTFIEQRTARDQYDRLFQQAREAGIPVLNWNRFQILTGMTQR